MADGGGATEDDGVARERSRWMGPAPDLPATRIASLVPSLTDGVFQLGRGDAVVARTEYCVRPRGEVERVEVVGGTKNPDVRRLIELRPDVVLANREENTRRKVERLARQLPVLVTDLRGPGDVPALWRDLGEVTGAMAAAERLAAAVEARIAVRPDGDSRPSFVYWIWRDPWMVAGHGTYISELLEVGGWRNVLPSDATRYPKLAPQEAFALEPETLLFSSEPFDFRLPRDLEPFGGGWRETDGGAWRRDVAPTALAVDGERLSWYPSLTLEGLEYAAELRRRVM